MAEIMMPLLNEGTEVWRPIQASEVATGLYRVDDAAPDGGDEEWAFAKGDVVTVESRTFSDGRARPAAIRKAMP